jgi:alkanesulfonate monooxygenase SsuD/methylene tetrahydromethanopterin reductase-like flavin-dependent oxidoreductase (luciferase family)
MTKHMTDTHDRLQTSAGYEIVMPARKLHAQEVIDLAKLAEQSGWTGVWLSELMYLDAAVLLGALSRETAKVRFGTSIVPLTTRSAALLAMMASTLGQLVPGRFFLGIGASTPTIVGDRHDRVITRPVATATGVLSVVRRAVRGEVVGHGADPEVTNLRVEAPAVPTPVYLAALGPRMVQVAYEHADGLILNLVTHGPAAELAQEGRRIAGPAFETLLSQRVCVSPTLDDMAAIRREIASYCQVEVYAANLARQGWDLEELRTAPRGKAADLLPDDLLHELVVLGTATECRDRLDTLERAGVTPLAVPVGTGDAARRLLTQLGSRV